MKHFEENYATCISAKTGSNIVVEDKKSKGVQYKIENKQALLFHVIEIDGCVFKEKDGKKCDYLVLQNAQKIAIFVELKGKDISSAVQQILATFDKLHIYLPDYKVFARIVGKSLPNIANTPHKNILEKKLKAKNKEFQDIEAKNMYHHQNNKLVEDRIQFRIE